MKREERLFPSGMISNVKRFNNAPNHLRHENYSSPSTVVRDKKHILQNISPKQLQQKELRVSRISHRQQDMFLFVKHPFSFLTLFSWIFACVLCLECSNIFNDLYFLIKCQRCAKAHSTISATDRDYSTLGVLLMPCNTILDEPLMFWHDWLTKTPPIKATYRRKWDLWGMGGSTSVTVYEGVGERFVEEGVVSEDSRCLSRKSELALTQETDEQCVRALWFMDRTLFSGCWGFHWNKRRNSLRRSNWQLCQFTVTTVQISNCQATWEKVPSKRR